MAERSVIAIAAHPDDIEFMMAGTLSLLRQAGYRAHYFNLSTGNCGSLQHGPAALTRIRRREARDISPHGQDARKSPATTIRKRL
jgi:LmbE family N-acetylglucosaminyl deacetylase